MEERLVVKSFDLFDENWYFLKTIRALVPQGANGVVNAAAAEVAIRKQTKIRFKYIR